jgi:hypothetical protein
MFGSAVVGYTVRLRVEMRVIVGLRFWFFVHLIFMEAVNYLKLNTF